MELKVQRKDYEEALSKVERASKDYADAVARVAATNKNFQTSANGAWAIAQAEFAGSLEQELRAVGSGLEDLTNKMQDIASNIDDLFVARDDVFSVVDSSATNGDTSAFQSGLVVIAGVDAQSGVQGVRGRAQDIIDACDGLDNAGGITDQLGNLQKKCNGLNGKFIDFLSKYHSYADLVSDLNSKSSSFGADKFVSVDMIEQSYTATFDNIGVYGHIKEGIKITKDFVTYFGESMKGRDFRPWKTDQISVKAELSKKFLENTQGIELVSEFDTYMRSNVSSLISRVRTGEKSSYTSLLKLMGKDFLKQHASNINEIKAGAKEFGSYSMRKAEIEAFASENNVSVANAEKFLGKAANSDQLKLMGKGLKAGSRYLGYAGQALTVFDSVKASYTEGFSQGDYKQGAGQLAKGACKIGTSIAMGAAIGTAFGGPVGTVVGIVVGGVLGAAADEGIDDVFSMFGIKDV